MGFGDEVVTVWAHKCWRNPEGRLTGALMGALKRHPPSAQKGAPDRERRAVATEWELEEMGNRVGAHKGYQSGTREGNRKGAHAAAHMDVPPSRIR